eukprot:PhF_6_TR27950/c0_g1_i1/m.41238
MGKHHRSRKPDYTCWPNHFLSTKRCKWCYSLRNAFCTVIHIEHTNPTETNHCFWHRVSSNWSASSPESISVAPTRLFCRFRDNVNRIEFQSKPCVCVSSGHFFNNHVDNTSDYGC